MDFNLGNAVPGVLRIAETDNADESRRHLVERVALQFQGGTAAGAAEELAPGSAVGRYLKCELRRTHIALVPGNQHLANRLRHAQVIANPLARVRGGPACAEVLVQGIFRDVWSLEVTGRDRCNGQLRMGGRGPAP